MAMNVGNAVGVSLAVSLGCAVGSMVKVALDVGVSEETAVCVGIAVRVKGTLVSAIESAVASISSTVRLLAHELSKTEKTENR